MKKLFVLFVLFGVYFPLLAQDAFELKGIIFHNESKQRVNEVSVQSLKTNLTSASDSWGTFNIETFVGDTLVFSKAGFQDVIKPIIGKQNLVIYLSPVIMLDEVTVKEKSKAAEQQEILDAFRGKGVYFNGSPPLLFSLFHPLTAIHELLSKDAANAKRFSNHIARENAQSMVDVKFNKNLILKHSPIKEEDLAEFMYYYRPSPEQVAKWNEYDVIKYIKDSYQRFLKEKRERVKLQEIK